MTRRRPAAWLALLLTMLAAPALADRLHLESGGVVDTSRWWVDGDTLMYEGAGGVIGVPRSIVLRIEPSRTTGKDRPRARSPIGETRPARSSARDVAEIAELLQRAHTALEGREYDLASSHYLSIVQRAPDLHAARVGYAMSEIALGHDGSALSVVLDGLGRHPDHPELLELLGLLRYRDERVGDALRAWRRAFELQPSDRLREQILKAERELHASRDYDLATSPHFTLRFDGEVDGELASAVLDFLEEQYWVLADHYRHSPPQPITVLLYPRREFRDVTQTPEWVGGIYDGKIRVPLGGLSRLHGQARRVLQHELAHAVLHSKSRGTAPRWLHEGLAQMAEGKRGGPSERAAVVAQLKSTRPAAWPTLEFSYANALLFTEYLVERSGFGSLVRVVELLGEGRVLDQVLRDVYGEAYATLVVRWGRALLDEARR